jgi:hypothetical protein
MSADLQHYRERQYYFTSKAQHCTAELAALWREIASSYQFLADHEEDIEASRQARGREVEQPPNR